MRLSEEARLMRATVVCTLLLAARAYPSLYIGQHANGCDDHPVQAFSRHGAPSTDSAITFSVSQGGAAATQVCPGQTYDLQVQLGRASAWLLTVSSGNLTNSSSTCPNQATSDIRAPGGVLEGMQFTAPCTAPGALLLKVTAASGSSAPFRINQLSLPLNTSCPCSPDALNTSASASPPPSSSTPPVLPATVPVVTLPGCQPSSLGYACARQLSAPGVTLHFTHGGASPPPNLCTGPGGVARGQAAADPGSGPGGSARIHWALEAAVPGYVALGWSPKAGRMIPLDTVIGGVADNGRPYLATYRLETYSISAPNLPAQNWALGGGVVRSPAGTTILCFSTAAAASGPGSGGGAGSRRLHQLLNQGVTGPANSTHQLNWAAHYTNRLGFHALYGGAEVNPATGAVKLVRILDKRPYIIAHGVLMLLAFVLLMPTAVLLARHRTLYLHKELGGKGLWFQLHLACMLLAVACFVASFVVILVAYQGKIVISSKHFITAHNIIGTLLVPMVAIQVLLALLARPAPASPRRSLWNLIHHNWGRLVVLLAWVNCALGIAMMARQGPAKLAAWIAPTVAVIGLLLVVDMVLTLVRAARERAALSLSQAKEVGLMAADTDSAAKQHTAAPAGV
ncbi:hypothetical protein V8C86DRAFT_2735981 [Haematococcus lacustris]